MALIRDEKRFMQLTQRFGIKDLLLLLL